MDRPSFPGFDKLYRLQESRLAFSADYRGEMLSRDDERRLVRTEWRPAEPIEFIHNIGKVPLDLVYGSVGVFLISPAAVEAFSTAGLTGWTTFPVSLFGRDHQLVAGYVGLAVTGRCGPVQAERAIPTRRISPGGRPYLARLGMYFDESTWSGDDLVMPSTGPSDFILSEAAKAVVKRAKLRNMGFEPLTEYEHFEMKTQWLDPRAN